MRPTRCAGLRRGARAQGRAWRPHRLGRLRPARAAGAARGRARGRPRPGYPRRRRHVGGRRARRRACARRRRHARHVERVAEEAVHGRHGVPVARLRARARRRRRGFKPHVQLVWEQAAETGLRRHSSRPHDAGAWKQAAAIGTCMGLGWVAWGCCARSVRCSSQRRQDLRLQLRRAASRAPSEIQDQLLRQATRPVNRLHRTAPLIN